MRDLRVNWICKLPVLVDKVRAWHTKNTAGVLQATPASDAGAMGIAQQIATHARIAGDIVCNERYINR